MKYFWILMFAAAMVYAQMNLNGSIVDADLKGIPDVTVTAPEYGLTAMSDSNGKFTIVSSTEATGIRNYSTQSTSIDPNGNYRIFVPNGARRLLPFSAISGLRDGIYYLAQGRSYRAQIKVMVMNGRIVSQAPVREVSAAESTQMNLRKASTTTTLNLTRPGVVDTTLIVNPLSGKIEMIVPRSGPTQANVTQLDPALDRRDGHEYQVIQVGDQSWFAENLAYDPGAAGNSWCTQNNDCESYGRLYDYATAKTACPAGWRLPSDDDWNTLQAFIKTNYTDTATNFWRSSPKTANLGLSPAIWLSGTPTSVLGFQALPSGVWNPYKTTERFFGSGAFFWSSTATDTNASARVLLGTKDGVFNYTYPQKMGMSVRCMRGVGDADGFVTWEKWIYREGNAVEDMDWTKLPSEKGNWTSLESPTQNMGDSFAIRVRGYITAPHSGNYTFWIASDGNSQFELSTDVNPANLHAMAFVANPVQSREWNSTQDQKSASVGLTEGQRYYFEIKWKEGMGADHFALAWNKPNDAQGAAPEVVPGMWLSPVKDIQLGGVGFINWERWVGVNGGKIKDIPTNLPPTEKGRWNTLEAPVNTGDGLAYLVKGLLTPPFTGDYTFWISSDDESELFLSSDSLEVNEKSIAFVKSDTINAFTEFREWHKYSFQKSEPIKLNAGCKYFIKSKMKEESGSDHLSVGWILPTQSQSYEPQIINGSWLSPN